MTVFNYYLEGAYFNGDAYHEKFDDNRDQTIAVKEIEEAAIEFVKMDNPKEHAASVVQFTGLRIVQEVA